MDAVGGLLPYLSEGSHLTMTIRQVKSGDYSVYFVTDTSSDAIVDPMEQRSYKGQ